MPIFLITGYDGEETIFYRETPHHNGVGPLLNQAIRELSQRPNSMIIIESLHEDSPETQMEKHIPFADYEEFYVDEWDAESTKKSGKVITMSGKPHKPRKLKQDQGISPEEAIQRIAFRSETSAWVIEEVSIYDSTYGSKADGSLYNPDSNERIDFEEADVRMDYYIPPMENIYVDYDEDEDEDEDVEAVVEESMMEAEGFHDEDGIGPKFMAEGKKNCGCGQDPCKTYGAETQKFRSPLDDSFDEIL